MVHAASLKNLNSAAAPHDETFMYHGVDCGPIVMFKNRKQWPTPPTKGFTETIDALDNTAQLLSEYQLKEKLPGTGLDEPFETGADVTGGGTTVAEEAGGSVAPVALVALVAFCIWVEHTNLMDADPGAGLVLLHTLLG